MMLSIARRIVSIYVNGLEAQLYANVISIFLNVNHVLTRDYEKGAKIIDQSPVHRPDLPLVTA